VNDEEIQVLRCARLLVAAVGTAGFARGFYIEPRERIILQKSHPMDPVDEYELDADRWSK
jgi:hypothetical protein